MLTAIRNVGEHMTPKTGLSAAPGIYYSYDAQNKRTWISDGCGGFL